MMMSKADKILERWERITDESFETVDAMLRRKGFVLKSTTGSHNIYTHPELKKAYSEDPVRLADFGPLGAITVPSKNGRRVKQYYLRLILWAFQIIEKRGH